MYISNEAKEVLLNNAYNCILGKINNIEVSLEQIDDEFVKEIHGVFIQLIVDGVSKGIMGEYEPNTNLIDTINKLASNLIDTSNNEIKLEKHELSYMEIKISILSKLTRIYKEEDIIIGKHGIIIKHLEGNGIMLPIDAQENCCEGRTIFLNEACHNAGLPSYQWQEDDCEVYRFETEVFKKDYSKI